MMLSMAEGAGVGAADIELLTEANERHPGSAALALADLSECIAVARGMGLAEDEILGLLRVAEGHVRSCAGLVGAS